jgi:acetyltransferase-like isoleucine patch superfamily enzyme
MNPSRFVKRALSLSKYRRFAYQRVSIFASIRSLNRIQLGNDVLVEAHACLDASSDLATSIWIGNNTAIRRYALVQAWGGSIKIGANCSINSFCCLYGTGGIFIGDFVRIADHTVIVASEHIFERKDIPIAEQGFSVKGIHIEDNVWIGAHVVIQDGVTIGTGSIIGSGAIVTRDIPSWSIAVGVPAKVVRPR